MEVDYSSSKKRSFMNHAKHYDLLQLFLEVMPEDLGRSEHPSYLVSKASAHYLQTAPMLTPLLQMLFSHHHL